MNRIFLKSFVASALAFGGLALVPAAHARTDLTVVVNAPRPVQAAPVWVQPRPIAHDRFDRFDRRDRRGVHGDSDRDGVPNLYDRDSRFYDAREARRHVRWSDFDRDGVPDRFDRAPRNPRWN